MTAPALPPVKRADWVRNPIDAFVLAKLEAKGLQPSAAASPQVLVRRVAFDLTGLPPTPDEVAAFVREFEKTPDTAYERLIDRLLASPHYGERWGRHWLDAVRFGESHGFERDQPRDHAWRYRDYVIKSFNEDKPFADFVREQLAGDALKPPTRDGVIATGFLVAGPWDQVGHSAPSRTVRVGAREDEMEEILAAVGQTFLGLTINCARCHDHKFDPIPAQDYYRLKAVFAGVSHGERSIASAVELREREQELARYQAVVDELQAKIGAIEKRGRDKVQAKTDGADLPQPMARWSFDGDARDHVGKLHGTLKGGARVENGRLVLDGKGAYVETPALERDLRAKTLEAWIALGNLQQRGGAVLSVETLNGQVFDAIVFGEREPRKWIMGSNVHARTSDVNGPAEKATAEELVHIAVAQAADGRVTLFRNGEPHGDSYVPRSLGPGPVTFKSGTAHVLIGKRHTGGGNAFLAGAIDEARLYDRALTADEVRTSFRAGPARISRQHVLAALSADDRRELTRLETELTKMRAARPAPLTAVLAYAASVQQPGPTHLLKRGDPDLPGEPVTAGPPASVKGPPADFGLAADAPEAERRRHFADWVVHPDNPLSWRVIVNRVWQHHFGEGIVRTPNDFGFNGERPSHPELLDWLAATLRQEGGRIKKLHRAILLSATYRQSSSEMRNEKANPQAADADNRLLWRYPLRRLEAEAVRDAMLAFSGQLNLQAGGPSFRPFKIEVFNSTFYRLLDLDTPELNRRSVYRMAINSARDPLLDVLDCPDPSVKTPRRATTTTPMQALALMNNAFAQRQSRAFAERVQKEAGENIEAQVAMAYRYAIARAPSKEETAQALLVAKEHGMRPVCWAILNSSEFVFLR